MRQIIKYNTDKERLQAGAEREKCHAMIDANVGEIINVHNKLKARKGLHAKDLSVLDMVLEITISDSLHAVAERDFLLRQIHEKGGEGLSGII
ncbi:MAG: hypothetical protein ACXABY_14770 [Candidatus Thorarchaeota archaeon]|jgi:hypothetical protein